MARRFKEDGHVKGERTISGVGMAQAPSVSCGLPSGGKTAPPRSLTSNLKRDLDP